MREVAICAKRNVVNKLLVISVLLFFILASAPLVLAQENFRSDEVSTLSSNEIIDKDYFATGEKVTLSGTVNGDAYLAGGDIFVDGVVNGDLLVAGGNININGEVTGDVRSFGGSIQIDGLVGGNITTVGGNIRVDDSAQISGSLVTGGGSVEVLGPIGRDITAGAGSLMIANAVGGDIAAGVGDLTLTSGASVSGDLNYISEEKGLIADGANISGVTKHSLPPEGMRDRKGDEADFAGLIGGFAFYKFLSLLAIGSLLLYAFPNFMKDSAGSILKKPMQALGAGFLILIIMPIAAVILMVTLIGLPLGLIALAGYLFLLYIAKIFVAFPLGVKILGAKTSRYWALIIGLAILIVVGLVPVLGWLVEFVAVLMGLGVIMLTKKTFIQNLRAKKLL